MSENLKICACRFIILLMNSDRPHSTSYGKLFPYDKAYDRITTRAEKPLQILDRIRYNPTTSEDIVIQQVGIQQRSHFSRALLTLCQIASQLASKNKATVYATDNILSLLMCAPRSVYSWDIIIVREGDKLFFDKRDGGLFGELFLSSHFSACEPFNNPNL